MSRIDEYRVLLKTRPDWDEFLLSNSGLPGPRGNIELAQAVAEEGNLEFFLHCISYSPELAPVNSPYEFLAFCGILGLGRLLAEGDERFLPRLYQAAADPRWRTREAVAMALQRWGDAQIDRLVVEMRNWAQDDYFQQRAAAAALCEPRLLEQPQIVLAVLEILDTITLAIVQADDRKCDGFIALRKGLAYCWSVAVAASPSEGKTWMEKWLVHPDRDVRWIMKENLKKNRLSRMDAAWKERWLAQIG